MIKDIFNCQNEQEMDAFMAKCIDDYCNYGEGFSNPQPVRDYFRLLFHYLMTERPVPERNIGSVLKLVGASYMEKGYRTPFWSILRESAAHHPEDRVFAQVRLTEAQMGNEDIDEIFRFLESELIQQPDERERERDLGTLAVCRVCYQQSRVRNIRMKRRVQKEEKKAPSAFLEDCARFVKEYTPHRIKAYLDRFVVGQDEAKEVLSTAVYNHYLRILHPEERLVKTNVLMVGPSGCGKTELIRRISELIRLPVVITDFSGIVATPWKGRNKEEALQNLYVKAERDLELCQCGIVFCDEFDKVIPSHRYTRGGDINDELQGQLLGMFEGTELDVPLQEGNGGAEILTMDTTNILFICAGAFEGLDKIVRRDYVDAGIGFSARPDTAESFEMNGELLRPKHLMEYGMKPELAGRLATVTVLEKLDRRMMRQVLTEAEDNILCRYENEFRIGDEIELRFTEEALEQIVERTMEMSIGARGLNAVVREVLAKPLFETPTLQGVREVRVTGAAVRGEERPEYIR